MIAYNINKDKRVVVARFVYNNSDVPDTHFVLAQTCWNILSAADIGAPVHEIVDSVLASWGEPIGKAICHEDDIWDEEYGKQLAKVRLLKKWSRLKKAVLLKLKERIANNYTMAMLRLNDKLV